METRSDGFLLRGVGSKWQTLTTPVKVVITAITGVLGLWLALKVLPILVAAMGLGLIVAILFVPYWIPTIVAFVRKHPSRGGILFVNLFFGWTVLGWLFSLAWALGDGMSHVSQQVVVVNNNNVVSASSINPSYRAQFGEEFQGSPIQRDGSASPRHSMPPASSVQYHVGDVVNGYRFNGQAWVPVEQVPAATVPPPPPNSV